MIFDEYEIANLAVGLLGLDRGGLDYGQKDDQYDESRRRDLKAATYWAYELLSLVDEERKRREV